MEDEKTNLTPGTLVVCRHRMPSTHQPWLYEIPVGEIEKPGTDPAEWNRTNSEEYYCTLTKKARVRYPFGVEHDSIEYLTPITPEQAGLSPIDKVELFLGKEARLAWERACR